MRLFTLTLLLLFIIALMFGTLIHDANQSIQQILVPTPVMSSSSSPNAPTTRMVDNNNNDWSSSNRINFATGYTTTAVRPI